MNLFIKTIVIAYVSFFAGFGSAADERLSVKQKWLNYSVRVRHSLKIDSLDKYNRKIFFELDSGTYIPLSLEEAAQKIEFKQIMSSLVQPLDRLVSLIEQTPETQLVDTLTLLYVDQKKQVPSEYPDLRQYILIAGGVVFPSLNKLYNKGDAKTREKILSLIGMMRLNKRKGLVLVKKGLEDSDQAVRLQAENTLGKVLWWIEDKPELKKLLIDETDLWFLKPRKFRKPQNDNYSVVGKAAWYEKLFQLVKTEKANFYDFRLFGATKDCPEQVIGKNLDFLMKSLLSPRDLALTEKISYLNSQANRDVVARLLFKIQQKKYLIRLHPILNHLLLHKSLWGAHFGEKSFLQKKIPKKANSGMNDYLADVLLKRIAGALTVEKIEQWQRNVPSNILSDLFLQALLAKKKGLTFDVPVKKYPVRITVVDRSNNMILASSDYVLNYAEQKNVELKSKVKDFPDYNLTLKAVLNEDKLRFDLSVLIDFKPHGVGFDAWISMAGSYGINLTNTKNTVWLFEHLYQAD